MKCCNSLFDHLRWKLCGKIITKVCFHCHLCATTVWDFYLKNKISHVHLPTHILEGSYVGKKHLVLCVYFPCDWSSIATNTLFYLFNKQIAKVHNDQIYCNPSVSTPGVKLIESSLSFCYYFPVLFFLLFLVMFLKKCFWNSTERSLFATVVVEPVACLHLFASVLDGLLK